MTTSAPARFTPPHSAEMERAVLGAILLEPEALPKAMEELSGPEDYYKPAHRRIYRAALDLFERGEPADMMTVAEQLRKSGADGEKSIEYLADLLESTPTAANVRVHARVVGEKALLRRLLAALSEGIQIVREDAGETAAIADRVERMVMEASRARDMKTLAPVKAVLGDSIKTVERLYENKSLITGAPTGYKDIDGMLAGLQPSDLVIIAGRPSMGKTAFAMNVASNVLEADPSAVVAVFSLEMSAEALVLRMLCSEARVSAQKIKTGYLGQADWPKLTTAAGRIHAWKMYIDDTAAQTALDIRGKARRLMAEAGRLDLVIVDYLQLMTTRGKVESRVLEVSEITRSLKALAKELNTPVVALSQLSRRSEERTDKRPRLSDLRESGSIEQDADVVMFVHREEFYFPEKPGARGKAEIIIGKQRNGPVGAVNLAFLKDYTRFENLSEMDHGS